MKQISVILFVALSAWTFQACSSGEKKNEDSVENAQEINEDKGVIKDDDDSDFAVETTSGGMMEVELGKLAQEKAQNERVRNFGKMMVTDHTKVTNELKALAARKNLTLPTTIGQDHQKHIDDLAKLTGAEFDRQYVKLMVNNHKKGIKKFEEVVNDSKDADFRTFAAKTLPTLQKHYDAIQAIDKTMY